MSKLPKLLMLWLVGFSMIAMPLQAIASWPELTISSLSSSVHLEFDSPAVDVKEQIHPDGTFSTFETSLPLIGQPAKPALPIMTQMVGVPSNQMPHATIELATAQPLAMLEHPVEPMPTYERLQTEVWRQALNDRNQSDTLDSETLEARLLTDDALYARDEWYPAQPIEIGEPMTLRGQMVVEITFHPVQVNLVTGQARWFSSADVTLDWSSEQFLPNMAFVEDPHYESFLASTLSNYEQAKAWRIDSSNERSRSTQAARSADVAGSTSWMITIEGQGLFAIPFSQLQAAGVDTSTPERLALYYGSGETAQEQAIWIDNEILYFVNTHDHNRWSKEIVYRLELLSTGSGKRMSTLSSPPTQATTIDSVPYELRFEENTLYESLGAVAGATDRWYWQKFLALPVVAPSNSFSTFFALPGLVNTHTAESVTITTELAPLESGCHHARILINDVQYAEKGNGCEWSGLTAFDQSMSVPHMQMHANNQNKFTIQQELQQGKDTLMLNSFTVRYQRSLTTEQNGLIFDSDRSSGVNFNVIGITQLFLPLVMQGQTTHVAQRSAAPTVSSSVAQNNSTFLAFEISTLGEPKRLTDGTQSGSSFSFGRATPANERYLLIQQGNAASVDGISAYTNSDLRNSSNQADYLIVTHPDFANALQPLVTHRQSACGTNRESCTVKLVTTTQIYNEFGTGIIDPQAIRDFLQHAYQNWSNPAPAYLLLVGDATYDPFDYTGGGKKVWLPPWMIDIDPWLGEVPGDHGYVVALGAGESASTDVLADMYSGRLPVSTAAQASAVVQKIINYETNAPAGDWQRSILLTTDDTPDDAGDFYALSDSAAQNFTSNMIVTRAYMGQSGYENDIDVRNKIAEKMNEGIVISQYIGHSSRTQWALPAIWTTSRSDGTNDLDLLAANTRLPVNVPWTCLEGYFILPDKESIAEDMLRMSDRGIIASFSPTGLDVATGHDVLTQKFYQGIFEERQIQLGPLVNYSKSAIVGTQYQRMLYTYMYLGDPALYMNIDLP